MKNSWQDERTLPSMYENVDGPLLITNGNECNTYSTLYIMKAVLSNASLPNLI